MASARIPGCCHCGRCPKIKDLKVNMDNLNFRKKQLLVALGWMQASAGDEAIEPSWNAASNAARAYCRPTSDYEWDDVIFIQKEKILLRMTLSKELEVDNFDDLHAKGWRIAVNDMAEPSFTVLNQDSSSLGDYPTITKAIIAGWRALQPKPAPDREYPNIFDPKADPKLLAQLIGVLHEDVDGSIARMINTSK
jgi:hypothetical protein